MQCCSGEKKELYYGRLTHWLKEKKDLPADQTYYLCGRAEMVVEVRDILLNKRYPL